MTTVVFLVLIIDVAAAVLTTLAAILGLFANGGPENRRTDAMPNGDPSDPNGTPLRDSERKQRTTIGCLGAAPAVVILGVVGALFFGYQLLEFLRDLGRGHPR